MTLLMDNLPSYKKYPKRSRGMICSTDKSTAGDFAGFGNINHIIPYDTTKIAVASSFDIWESFPAMINNTYQVSDFNDYLDNLFNDFNIQKPKTWSDLKSALIQLNTEYDKFKDTSFDYGDKILKVPLFDTSRDIMKYLNTWLSPTKNGMKMGINNLKPDREIWIQGESTLVNETLVDSIIEDVIDEI